VPPHLCANRIRADVGALRPAPAQPLPFAGAQKVRDPSLWPRPLLNADTPLFAQGTPLFAPCSPFMREQGLCRRRGMAVAPFMPRPCAAPTVVCGGTGRYVPPPPLIARRQAVTMTATMQTTTPRQQRRHKDNSHRVTAREDDSRATTTPGRREDTATPCCAKTTAM
jgi:hypothetical protein